VKGVDIKPNDKYRSKVGILNWLTMGIRLDLVYITKELSRVLAEPTKIANELVERAIEYTVKSKHAHLTFSLARMQGFTPPKTRKKPTDYKKEKYAVEDYNQDDGIEQVDEKDIAQDYIYKGDQITTTGQTDIDLAGQVESRQSTSGYIIYLNGALIHYRAATERIIIQSTAAGEYIALSRGNTAAKFVRDILKFYGNTQHIYFLYTDNQAAEHIATQPNTNEHSRSIDIRHHAIRQDYVDGLMRIGGVDTQDNTSDILTKFLQPPLHIKHTSHLHINTTNSVTNTHTSLQSHVTHATLKQPKSIGTQTSHHHSQKRNDTQRKQPKPKHNRRRGEQPHHVQTHTRLHAHTYMCPTHTLIQPKYSYPDFPYQTPDKWDTHLHPGPCQTSLPRNCEQTPKRR
jgi:hypothetical protein